MGNVPKPNGRESLAVSHPADMNPEDWARFIELRPFTRNWKKLGLDDVDRSALHAAIMLQPDVPVVPGTGGLRKIRFASERWDQGKRGGARICYAYFVEQSVVFLIMVYLKKKKEDLSAKEKREIKALLTELRTELDEGNFHV